jgi:hypothetical protein
MSHCHDCDMRLIGTYDCKVICEACWMKRNEITGQQTGGELTFCVEGGYAVLANRRERNNLRHNITEARFKLGTFERSIFLAGLAVGGALGDEEENAVIELRRLTADYNDAARKLADAMQALHDNDERRKA